MRFDMGDPPALDHPDRFDPARIRLGDVDGTGFTGLVYLGADGVRRYRSHAGNAWGPAEALPPLPRTAGTARVDLVDLLGTGTACFVWRDPGPGPAGHRICYVDLAGTKPFLQARLTNNIGAETTVGYLLLTYISLADREAGRSWSTRLPLPVQVVAGSRPPTSSRTSPTAASSATTTGTSTRRTGSCAASAWSSSATPRRTRR